MEDLENPIVGELLGPNGEQLLVILERPVVPIGFQSKPKVPSRVIRYDEED